ncbi:hypothetical protein L211DRAFT_797066, partial [Terfezia boudieri ATCC MYA-4762]
DRFQQFFRMSKESFLHIHSKIKDHLVFHNNSKNPQVASSKQLAVCLRRLACESSTAGSNMNVGQVFGIGDGTVTLYTHRVLLALMDLWEEVVQWPSREQWAAMKARLLEDARGLGWGLFRNYIGLLDGTLVPIKCCLYQ